MKQYAVNGKLTLVGKAWEIRHQLKLLAKSSAKTGNLPGGKSTRTLGEYLRTTAN
ncbi:Z-ring formation inhibitor MciZ [Paenibacillus silvisoli]|uniref:Z-ring formation inhibitor MciZ n=1 Tax=Paenibacillus silvisoli TaxID=3110539 RepID=UPI00389929A7